MTTDAEYCPFNILGTCTICWHGYPAPANRERPGEVYRCMAWNHIEQHCNLIKPHVGIYTLEDGDQAIPLYIKNYDF